MASPTRSGSAGYSGGTLTVAAAPGKTNGITVDQPGQIVVRDTSDTVSAGNGCTPVNANTVTCSAAGIQGVAVNSRDLNDQIFYNAHVGGALQGRHEGLRGPPWAEARGLPSRLAGECR